MPYKEREIEKVYFTIAEVAAMVHQATSAVRFWEDEFHWFNPKRNRYGNRHYTRDDIKILMQINFLLLDGKRMTIPGVRNAHNGGYEQELIDLFLKKERGGFPTIPLANYPLTLEEAFDPGINADQEYPIIK